LITDKRRLKHNFLGRGNNGNPCPASEHSRFRNVKGSKPYRVWYLLSCYNFWQEVCVCSDVMGGIFANSRCTELICDKIWEVYSTPSDCMGRCAALQLAGSSTITDTITPSRVFMMVVSWKMTCHVLHAAVSVSYKLVRSLRLKSYHSLRF